MHLAVAIAVQCIHEEICDIIQPEKQRLTEPYANNGLSFDRLPDVNNHIIVPPLTVTALPSKL